MVYLLKTNIMVFMRKYKPEPTQALRVRGKETVFTSSVKYSGALLHPKLNWKQHLTARRKRFYSSMWVCRRTMGKKWGISPQVALWMHRAIMLPKTLYVSVVCWPMVSRAEAKNLLQSLQGSYLRAAVESVKNTPIEAMEVALCLTPLALAVIWANRFTAYRLKHQGEWRNTGLGHIKLEFLQKYPLTLKQDRFLIKYQLVK